MPFYISEYGTSSWNTADSIHDHGNQSVRASFIQLANSELYVVFGCENGIGGRTYVNKYSGTAWHDSVLTMGKGVEDGSELHASSAYNDMYVVWNKNSYDSAYVPITNNYLAYRQYDSAPQTPQSFTKGYSGTKPKLTWDANREPDIQYYEIWRRIKYNGQRVQAWALLSTTTSTSYIDHELYVDCIEDIGWVEYKIKAKDVEANYSSFTSVVHYVLSGLNKSAAGVEDVITEYKLNQNYPNPFNPTTIINYQIPTKGYVDLRIYDMLGGEVKKTRKPKER